MVHYSIKKIKEGSAEIFIPTEKKISRKLPVFYNPVMRLNRDVTILLLQQFPSMDLCDPLAASGIRAIRFAKELKYKSIVVNDVSKSSVKSIKINFKLNKINNKKIKFFNEDANLLLLNSKGFDYIDIDPFGSSNYYLDAAIKRISRDGILAVTNTDTAALTGTFPKTCMRKYWSVPKKDHMMHESGLRILIRKIQLIGMQYEKALFPIFSYFKDHYFRIFFNCIKGKKICDEITLKHGMLDSSGPLWIGNLWDSKLVNKMYNTILKKPNKKNNLEYNELIKFLKIIKDESKINSIGFYDVHNIAKKYKLKIIMKKDDVIKKIKNKGFKASNTHFSGTGIRSNVSYDEFISILKE